MLQISLTYLARDAARMLRPPLLAACALAVVPAAARAEIIPAYFGWNYVADTAANAPATMELTSFTYFGGSGSAELMTIPSFPGYTGMPDAIGLAYAPTFTTTAEGGDGETTRTIGATLPIDWAPANTPTGWGTYAFPTIAISSFTTDVNGTAFGYYDAFEDDFYIVGLIQDTPQFVPPYTLPLPQNDELDSALQAPQGDIYAGANGNPGNPEEMAYNELPGTGDLITVTFAAATPEPASLAVLGCGLAGLALCRRRR